MTKKILIVDDDADLANLLADRLQDNGYAVVVAHDAAQGVRYAHEEHPDLIILDIMMPAGGGISTFNNLGISTHTSRIPVVIITAYDTEEVRKKVMDMGAKDFFTKPFKMEDILVKIEKVLKK
jgi:DNA-binding response OmpR family regulator